MALQLVVDTIHAYLNTVLIISLQILPQDEMTIQLSLSLCVGVTARLISSDHTIVPTVNPNNFSYNKTTQNYGPLTD